jgi:hypothetical protein
MSMKAGGREENGGRRENEGGFLTVCSSAAAKSVSKSSIPSHKYFAIK